jgi:site-specific recombinase XerD
MVKRIGNVTRQINKCICKIGKDLNLGNLSTYSARHSFASVMLWEGASVGFISQSLGHTNILTTTSYLSKFNVDKRKEEHDKLKL